MAVAIGVIGLSAFEAHIINVTATIENALNVDTNPIAFGTVFPQEALDATFDIALSNSFLDEGKVDDVNYMIRQKPKCVRNDEADDTLPAYGLVTEDDGEFVCDDATNYHMLPLLCPFLSKHEITADGEGENDSAGINAFHGPIAGWDLAEYRHTQVLGRLAKSEGDESDTWNIDFRVPCFYGQCAQDWADFVHQNNPNAIPADYVLPNNLEHELFGCDLWVEVSDVSRTGGGSEQLCSAGDVMLVLDRSGSVAPEIDTLESAAEDFVHALNPDGGVHVGQTSFADDGSLDTELTNNHALIDTHIYRNIGQRPDQSVRGYQQG